MSFLATFKDLQQKTKRENHMVKKSYVFLIWHNVSCGVMLVTDKFGETGTVLGKFNKALIHYIGLNTSPVGKNPIMASTLTKVGVIIPQGVLKVFFILSQKYYEETSMFWQ